MQKILCRNRKLEGRLGERDTEKAAEMLLRAAEQGNGYAAYRLGKLCLEGENIPRDVEKAVPLLEASAAQGNIYAQFLLEHMDSFREPDAGL